MSQGVYLTVCLGIPLSSANVDPVWMYLAGVKPAGLCIAAALCGLAALGWVRHFYWITGSKSYCIVIVSTLTLLTMAAALIVGLSSATEAARRASHTVRGEGRKTPRHFSASAPGWCA